ncbi:hypothetical protein MUK42_24690 [Musa troglodytarum]|uniref:Heparan-alpha-glucosaminide N-acetyltransferase catalytic domain-containing protein n=1 Tax=Musa troglodytarum TaxID=320322 RepID=A0A9E7GD80_9LILI|nr:hypothetical protein MUK42_24690 [Musa troglodytarum]
MRTYELIKDKDDLEAGVKYSRRASRKDEAFAGQKQGQRLVSLDVFRGLTVALMIFVDDAGALFPSINHSPWDGVALADFVMPFFLFIVGVALAITHKGVTNKAVATRKSVFRALKLFVVGLLIQGGFFHGLHNLTYGVDLLRMRWMGVLQRIAIAYLLAAICEIWLKTDDNVDNGYSLIKRYRLQLYVRCGVRGDTGPACNAVGMIDRQIFGIQHLHRRPVYERSKQCSINSPDSGPPPPDAPSWCRAPFDPEGLLSSVMATVTCLIGLQFGHVIIHFKVHKDRVIQWMVPSFCLLALAFSLDLFGMHMNKPLYTVSYTCVTAGAAGMLFTAVYLLVDVYGYRRPMLAMEWLGMHALVVYLLIGCNILPVLIQGFYWREPQNNLLKVIGIS